MSVCEKIFIWDHFRHKVQQLLYNYLFNSINTVKLLLTIFIELSTENLLTTAPLPICSIQYINTGVRKTNMDYGAPEKIRDAGTLRVSFGFPLTKQKAGMQDLCSAQGWCMVLRRTGSKITTGLELRIRLVLSDVERTGDIATFLYDSYGYLMPE
mgnify:CR=1 FL=1